MATVARVFVGMPKLVGLMSLGPASILIGMQGSKVVRNFTSTEEDNKGNVAGITRKTSVASRFTSGATPHLPHVDSKYMEKHLKNNSALRDHADAIREANARVS